MFIHLDMQRFLHVERHGQAGKPPVVLIHGNGETHEIFDVLIRSLEDEVDIYAFDSPGHGESYPVLKYDFDDMMEDIVLAVRMLDISNPVIAGFSDGGIIALKIALKYPSLPGSLLICGANLDLQGLDAGFLAQMQEAQDSLVKKTGQADPLLELMLTQEDIPLQALRSIRVPTFVAAGESDLIREQHTRLIAAAIPGARLRIFSGENHSSYIEHSDKLKPLILQLVEVTG